MKLRMALLASLALAQMAGDLFELPALRGLAAATAASPAPRVFSASGGLETYSTRFAVCWTDAAGAQQRLELTPRVAAQLRGPYNRRNVYGAALAYGPVLATKERTRPMLASVLRFALCEPGGVLAELNGGVAVDAPDVRVEYEPVGATDLGALPRTLAAQHEREARR
jgi:hypothetical protein